MRGRLQPLHFTPILKEKPWGGRQLAQQLGKFLPGPQAFGESWEIADCGRDSSKVAIGPLAGTSLREFVMDFPDELLGDVSSKPTAFPLLIKYLDANEWLSVQVHPDDHQSPTGVGKNEAWVILRAAPGSSVLAGLKAGVDREQLEAAIATGHVKHCLHEIPVSPGDCISIPAGTVHAIGPGIVLAEIQQQCDCTYRLDDWGRGRELHIREALDCLDFSRGPVHPVHPLYRASADGVTEELVNSPHFQLSRGTHVAPFELRSSATFSILMVVHGRGRLFQGDGIRDLRTGSTVLVPAQCQAAMCIPDRELTVLQISPGSSTPALAESYRNVRRSLQLASGPNDAR